MSELDQLLLNLEADAEREGWDEPHLPFLVVRDPDLAGLDVVPGPTFWQWDTERELVPVVLIALWGQQLERHEGDVRLVGCGLRTEGWAVAHDSGLAGMKAYVAAQDGPNPPPTPRQHPDRRESRTVGLVDGMFYRQICRIRGEEAMQLNMTLRELDQQTKLIGERTRVERLLRTAWAGAQQLTQQVRR